MTIDIYYLEAKLPELLNNEESEPATSSKTGKIECTRPVMEWEVVVPKTPKASGDNADASQTPANKMKLDKTVQHLLT